MENKNNIFSTKRLFLLLKRQVLGNLNGLLIAFAAIAGALLVVSLLAGYSNPASIRGLSPLYYVMLYVGGYVFTSNIFAELHNPQRSIPYLTLPVSNLERLANAWLLTAVMYPIFALIGIGLIIFLGHIILGIPLVSGAFSAVLSAKALNIVLIYVITQSLFLFGAVYFRKHNFLKTLLGLFVLQNVLGLFLVIMGYLLFGTLNFDSNQWLQESSFSEGIEVFITKTLPEILKFAFYYLMVPFFLLLTWFSIKERQV